MRYNPIQAIDAYKLDHRRQYPPGTRRVYSNFTPRSSRIPGVKHVVNFGLQAFLADYCEDQFADWFVCPEDEVAADYERMVERVIGPNDVGSDHIRELHQIGYLPLRFCALPEGTLVPLRVPMLTVENTHPDFFWLVNYIESVMSAELWLPSTSATQAWHLRRLLDDAAQRTGADPNIIPFQGHDFSMRGMCGQHAAAVSGAGHLLSFTGTDCIPALEFIDRFYPTRDFVGGSVAATEHSVMCAGGDANEQDTFDRLLELYPAGIVSVVSDTWDLWEVLTGILPDLHTKIMARDGKLVIRPDSGDPVDIICGTKPDGGDTPAERGVVQLLWDEFGGTVNAAGFKELDSHVGAIYGDSITYDRAGQMCQRLAEKGFASTNIILGVGSFTYQHVTRDTFGFAMKATWADINGTPHDLYKSPVTDDGVKNSATGRLAVNSLDGALQLIERATPGQELGSYLNPVWEDGVPLRHSGFSEVRANLASSSLDVW